MAIEDDGAVDRHAITLSNVDFCWPGKDGGFRLRIDGLKIDRGESVCLVGPSGGGKSTLLGLICGTLVPRAGDVGILGTRLNGLGSAARDRFRADHIGVIFQQFNLLPYLSVLDNVLLPLKFSAERRSAAGASPAAQMEFARQLLSALGIDAALARQKAATLSVGQQQRVAAARAFIGGPQLIVADEPTSSLDEERRAGFLQLLFDQANRTGATLLLVSHDPRMAQHFDRVMNMADICTASPEGKAA